ncbi:hypothetical protein [Chengkuizengella axinellae]|uniref:DUF4352 domain-containing protein n=1 Tax=Chengkuizengella axinellae TaxID=3064388 RepID=A0ABT9IZZ4_9BACL|nr:hypothetical protein [Chengkuizengella sp. 2205SS18-9]MDP5274945.1 hypothetical protein [Chengkuizengella sp. 2205SS18-9]
MKKIVISFGLGVLIILITVVIASTNEDINDEDKLNSNPISEKSYTLNGTSENWDLQGYELKFDQDTLTAGNGVLKYKLDEEITDYLSFEMIAIVDGEEEYLQGVKFVSSDMNFNSQHTGNGVMPIPLNKDNKEMNVSNIDKMYGVIKWKSAAGDYKEEVISVD